MRPDRRLIATLAWRFLTGRRSRLLTGTSRAALAATALGVTAMVVAMALMTGYRRDLQARLIRGNAAVVVYPVTPTAMHGEVPREELAALPGVVDVRRITYGQGSLASEGQPRGEEVTLRGIDGASGLAELGSLAWAPDVDPARPLTPAAGDPLPVLAGEELAHRLGAAPGASLRLMVLGFAGGEPRFRFRAARLAGTFATGFSEFDSSWVLADRAVLEELMGSAATSGLFEVAVAEIEEAGRVAERVRAVLGEDYLVTDWRDLNRELFTALKLQQMVLFFVLGLIVLVSTFNVASTLVVLVRERMRDLGVLSALGLPPRSHRAVFLTYGLLLGTLGAAVGVALGVLVAWAFTEFELIRFDPEMAAIYFISSVPFRVEWTDVAAIVAFTLAVTLLACWLPARRAGQVQPAAALRYE